MQPCLAVSEKWISHRSSKNAFREACEIHHRKWDKVFLYDGETDFHASMQVDWRAPKWAGLAALSVAPVAMAILIFKRLPNVC